MNKKQKLSKELFELYDYCYKNNLCDKIYFNEVNTVADYTNEISKIKAFIDIEIYNNKVKQYYDDFPEKKIEHNNKIVYLNNVRNNFFNKEILNIKSILTSAIPKNWIVSNVTLSMFRLNDINNESFTIEGIFYENESKIKFNMFNIGIIDPSENSEAIIFLKNFIELLNSSETIKQLVKEYNKFNNEYDRISNEIKNETYLINHPI